MSLRMLSPLLLLLSLAIRFGSCDDTACSYACQEPFSQILFNGSSPDDTYYTAQCMNLLRVQSIFLCMREKCSDHEIETGLSAFKSDCQVYGLVDLLPWSVISNISGEDVQSFPSIATEDLNGETIYDSPVLVGDNLWQISLKTLVLWDQSEVTRANYGYAMFGYFGVIVLISMVSRLANFISSRRRSSIKETATAPSSLKSAQLMVKRYVTTPALFRHHAAEPVGWCTVPPRLQSLTIAAFVIINVVLCCVSYDLFEGNLYWPDTRVQLWRYLPDRTGVISISNFVLIWAFAMRNNVLLWLTGWSFSTMNLFHRWAARVATIEAVIHSIGYTVEAFLEGGKAEYVLDWADRYWWMGVIATISMSLLCFFSLHPLRQLVYEFFLLVHIILAVLSLIGMWYHVEIFDGEYNGFIWPCVAVWVFDRVLRLARIAYLNSTTHKSTVTFNPDSNVLRINIPVRSATCLRPQAGAHYYLYMLNSAKFWESHPFTLATWESGSWSPETEPRSQEPDTTVSFILRPYNGFTARLRDKIIAQSQKLHSIPGSDRALEHKIRLAVEGPYAPSHNLCSDFAALKQYNSLLFVIGGSGITVALSHLQALHHTLTKAASPSTRDQLRLHQIHLVWAIRDESLYHDIYNRELSKWFAPSSPIINSGIRIQIDIYITGAQGRARTQSETRNNDNTTTSSNNKINRELNNPSKSSSIRSSSSLDRPTYLHPKEEETTNVQITPLSHPPARSFDLNTYTNRPPIDGVIASAAEKWCARSERLVVVACGPAGMMDDARAGIVRVYEAGIEGVDYWGEMFGW